MKMFNLSEFCFFFILNKLSEVLSEVQGIIAHVVDAQTELNVVLKNVCLYLIKDVRPLTLR